MRFLQFVLLAVIALFSGACERQPVGNDPDPRIHKGHGLAKHESVTAGKEDEHVKPTEGAKSEEAPKFFPEKK